MVIIGNASIQSLVEQEIIECCFVCHLKGSSNLFLKTNGVNKLHEVKVFQM